MRLQTIPQFAEEHGFSVFQVKELIRVEGGPCFMRDTDPAPLGSGKTWFRH